MHTENGHVFEVFEQIEENGKKGSLEPLVRFLKSYLVFQVWYLIATKSIHLIYFVIISLAFQNVDASE
jgi:hypothetical protein